MLDLVALKHQISAMANQQKQRYQSSMGRLDRAVREARRWAPDCSFLAAKVQASHTTWQMAGVVEPLSLQHSPPPRPAQLTVLATDGSQIFPDRHEFVSCYLINIGSIALHYGTGERPLLTSSPCLFYKDEDCYGNWGGRKAPVNSEIVSIRRNLLEVQELADLAGRFQTFGRRMVALTDGTLIFWSLEGKPDDFKKAALEDLRGALDRLAQARVPIAGYISYPNSNDVINALRVGLCPESPVECEHCPYEDRGALPCKPIERVRDRLLFDRLLRQTGVRSALFRSSSPILGEYGRHQIYFYYMQVGQEMARVEIPAWVAQDPAAMGLVHTAIWDQVQKGQGYPIALAEAHEKAVVRGSDRDLFFRMLGDAFVQKGMRPENSRKSLAKRRLMI